MQRRIFGHAENLFSHFKKERFDIMKKHMKVMAALSTTALMSGFSPALADTGNATTGFAASAGWNDADGGRVYYDSAGYCLTDTWTTDDHSSS